MLSTACEQCGLWFGCTNPGIATELPADGQKPDVFFVGGDPSYEDDVCGKPFMGASGLWFRQFLSTGDMPVAVGRAVRCRAREALKKHHLQACATNLKAEIEEMGPKVLVALGATAYQVLTGKKGSVTKLMTRPEKLGDRWLLTTMDPSNHGRDGRDLSGDYAYLASVINSILETGVPPVSADPDIRIIDRDNLSQALRQLSTAQIVSVDAEWNTTSKDKDKSRSTVYMPGRRILCIGVSTDPSLPTWVFPPSFFEALRPYLKGRYLLFHNAPSDVCAIVWCLGWSELLDAQYQDTFFFFTSRDRGAIGNSLQDLCVKYLRVPAWKQIIKDAIQVERTRRLAAKDPTFPTMEDVPFQTLAQYNGRDALYTLMLWIFVRQQGWEFRKSYFTLRIPSIRLLSRISLRGIGVDRARLGESVRVTEEAARYLQRTLRRSGAVRFVERAMGQALNVRATPDMQELVEATGVQVPRTATGKPSTKKEVLKELAETYPLWRRVMKLRSLENLLSKFLYPMRLHCQSRDGRVHPTYHAAKLSSSDESDDETGGSVSRLSAAQPPMQQVKKDKMFRLAIVPRPGKWLVEIDFSGAEPRTLAVLAGVKKLIKWFKKGVDPYLELYHLMWQKPHEDVTYDERQDSKAGFLARMYGQGAPGFAHRQKCTEDVARKFFKFFDTEFPEIPQYHRNLCRQVESGQETNTPWDSPRRFPVQGYSFNQLTNDGVQSTSSEILLFKADQIDRTVPEEQFAVVNLVHDSVWAEVSQENTVEILERVVQMMTNMSDLPWDGKEYTCPMEVKVEIGNTLGEMHKWAPGQPLPEGLLRSLERSTL